MLSAGVTGRDDLLHQQLNFAVIGDTGTGEPPQFEIAEKDG
jgi:hypothetical protein